MLHTIPQPLNKMRFSVFIVFILLHVNQSYLLAQNLKSNSPERIYLHTDRDAYIAGENVYFKVYQTALNTKQQSRYAYLIFRNIHNVNVINIRIELNNGISFGKFSIPDTLSTGIYQIVGYTNCLRNDPENAFFTKSIIIANRFDKELKNLDFYASTDITSDTLLNTLSPASEKLPEINNNDYLSIQIPKTIFKKREKIVVGLQLNKNFSIQSANISISVKRVIPGSNENNSILAYFNKTSQQSFNWKNCKFLQESQGIIISGIVHQKDQKIPAANQVILLSTPDSIPNLQYTKTNPDGTFKFMLSDFYFGKNLYLKLKDTTNAIISLDNKYHIEIPFTPMQIKNLHEMKQYLFRSQDFVTIQKDYFEPQPIEKVKSPMISNKFPRVYGKAQYSVYPSDFYELPDFIEISRELLSTLKIRKHKDIFEANMINAASQQYMPNPPLIFLDGVPIDHISQIIPLGSTKIIRIDACAQERHFGDLVFDGILSVHTGKKELANIHWKNPVTTYWELNNHPVSGFIADNMNATDSYFPNYKQLLYWEPNQTVNANQQIVFYASDNTGFFEINVQGITSEGLPISVQKTIQIVNE
jgi:hypothetical protein